MAAQRKRRKTRPHTPHTIQVRAEECRNKVSLSTAATISPRTAQASGASSTAGCLRTVMTSCSWGNRYLSTSAGGLAPGEISLMCAALVGRRLQRLQEGRDGVAGLREQVQKVVYGIASGLRLGK